MNSYKPRSYKNPYIIRNRCAAVLMRCLLAAMLLAGAGLMSLLIILHDMYLALKEIVTYHIEVW